jgi:hypothetical protein
MSTIRRLTGTAAAAAGLIALTALAPPAAAALTDGPPGPSVNAALTAPSPPLLTITLGSSSLAIGYTSPQVQDASTAGTPHPSQWQYLPARRAAPPARKIRRRHARVYTVAATAVTRPGRQQVRQAAAAPARSGAPQVIAQGMLAQYGWAPSQFSCLQPLWERESGWDAAAYNGSSGAFGIPQALPGAKMASAGADWQTDPYTQIRWGLGYIKDVYGSPCSAWDHEEADGWY